MEFQKRYQFDPKTDLLGTGVFSRVYKATDVLMQRTVAIKYFTAEASARFQILPKLKAVAKFDHENLCEFYDIELLTSRNVLGETEEVVVAIMEYIDGNNFTTYTKANPRHTDKLLTDILHGLSYLHKRGIIYGDLKPENILVTIEDNEPVAKIIDFGVGKISVTAEDNVTSLNGTVEYMPPEHFNSKRYGIGGQISTNLDLWSFGIIVYEAATDTKLFGSRSAGLSEGEVISNILHQFPLAQFNKLPAKYKQIVNKCIVKDAGERVQTASDLLVQFEKMTGIPANRPKKPRRPVRHPAPVAVNVASSNPVQQKNREVHQPLQVPASRKDPLHSNEARVYVQEPLPVEAKINRKGVVDSRHGVNDLHNDMHPLPNGAEKPGAQDNHAALPPRGSDPGRHASINDKFVASDRTGVNDKHGVNDRPAINDKFGATEPPAVNDKFGSVARTTINDKHAPDQETANDKPLPGEDFYVDNKSPRSEPPVSPDNLRSTSDNNTGLSDKGIGIGRNGNHDKKPFKDISGATTRNVAGGLKHYVPAGAPAGTGVSDIPPRMPINRSPSAGGAEVPKPSPIPHVARPKVDKRRSGTTSTRNRMLLIFGSIFLLAAAVTVYYFISQPVVQPVPGEAVENRPVSFGTPLLVKVDGGAFQMGSTGADAPANQKPAHLVNIGSFYMSKYEITVKEFSIFISDTKYVTTSDKIGFSWIYNGSDWVKGENVNWTYDVYGKFIGVDDMDLPVIHISWIDAVRYCTWLSEKTGKVFRLPTEAEWEFASRGGNVSNHFKFSGSDELDQVGWFAGNADNKIARVGQKKPNELGLYDMSGNVMEWCNDFYNENYYSEAKPHHLFGPETGTERVARGGSWFTPELLCRSTYRLAYPEDTRGGNIGFRICRAGE